MRPETTRCHEAVIVVWSTGGDCLTLNATPTFPPHEHTDTGNADSTGWHRSQPVNRAGDSEPGTVAGPPTERDPMSQTRPDVPVAACRSCNRAIHWSWTDKGRRMPLDAAPAQPGTPGVWELELEPDGTPRSRLFSPLLPTAGCTLHVPHWSSCPDADTWRPRK